MKKLRVFIFAINLFPLCVYANNSTELLKNIFQNYDKRTRPLLNISEHMKVNITFSLLTVHDLDMRNQELSSSAVISISWTDEFLKWNTSSYGGLGLIRVPLSEVWKPDVILTNSVNRKDIFQENEENVIIYNDGTVLWHSNKNLKTFVHVNTTNYPFEVQAFRFIFSKWYFDDTYQQNYYSSEDNATDDFVSNGEWVVNSQTEKTMPRYIKAYRKGKIFSDIIWQFKMKRQQKYYVWSYLIPTIAWSFISLLTFFLPVKSSEKLTLAVFSLLSNAVVIKLFNSALPSTSDNDSTFGTFLYLCLGLGALVIIINVIISCIYHRTFPLLNCCSHCCSHKHNKSETYTLKTEDIPDSEADKRKLSHSDTSTGTPLDKNNPNDANLSTVSQGTENSTLDTKSTGKTAEKEKEKPKRKNSRVAWILDIIFFLFFLLAYGGVYLWLGLTAFE